MGDDRMFLAFTHPFFAQNVLLFWESLAIELFSHLGTRMCHVFLPSSTKTHRKLKADCRLQPGFCFYFLSLLCYRQNEAYLCVH